MNATKRSAARAGLVACSVLAVALTGCRTQVVHERTRTVYVPAPPAVVHVPPAPAPPPVVVVPTTPAPQPSPPAVVVTPPAHAPIVVIQSENDFYEPLAAYGRWVVVGAYGRVWIPAHVEVGWRPYSNGYWQRTDAGWYWMSDEPWGWATYHYGRWDWNPQFGWVWVPQTQWAPAWVTWREGGGYIGWAPLRPSVTIGVSIGTAEYEPAFASRAFVFVEQRRMLEPVRPKTVIVNNTTIINKTVNITNVKVVNQTVINDGPRPEVIERASGLKVQAVPVHEFRRSEETTVAARQQNIPTSLERKVQPPARTEPQPAPMQVVTPRNAPVVEKPAVIQKSAVVATQPARPIASPTRPASPQIDAGKAARDENKPETTIIKPTPTPPPVVAPKARPEVKPAQAVPVQREVRPVAKPSVVAKPTPITVTTTPIRDENRPHTEIGRKTTPAPTAAPKAIPEIMPVRAVPLPQREVRPVEKSSVVAKPTPITVTTNPIRDESKGETASEKKDPATPLVVGLKPGNEVRPVAKPETKPALNVENVRPSPVRIQAVAKAENQKTPSVVPTRPTR